MSVLLEKSLTLTEELASMTVERVGLFPRGHVTIIEGEPGIGKTWFMLSIARSVATGSSGLGDVGMHYPLGKVLIFAGETGVRLLANRAKMMGDLADITNVRVISSHLMARLSIDTMCNTAIGRKNIMEAIKEFSPSIVFFDTMISFMSDGKDESSQVDIGDCIRGLSAVASETNTALVLIHHFRKRSGTSIAGERGMDDVIGSSAFIRLASLVIGIERKGSIRIVKCLKSWWEEFSSFSFVISSDDTGHVYLKTDYGYNADGTSSISRVNGKVQAFIRENYKDKEFSVMDVFAECGASRSAVQDAISSLLSAGVVEYVRNDGHTKIYKLRGE